MTAVLKDDTELFKLAPNVLSGTFATTSGVHGPRSLVKDRPKPLVSSSFRCRRFPGRRQHQQRNGRECGQEHGDEGLVDPTLSDLQAEYADAITRGRTWGSARIWMIGHIALLKVLAEHGCLTAFETLRDLTGDDRGTVRDTIAAGISVKCG